MTLEEAIQTAIDYEIKIRDAYEEASKKTADTVGQRVFGVLAKEEQGHVDYLQDCLTRWHKDGHLNPTTLGTILPPKELIEAEMKKLEKPLEATDRTAELDLLKGALEAEEKTSKFYERMVAELPAGERDLFRPFVEIEVGHQAIVQAEIDALVGHGHWFDFMEINLEAG